jgi:predicted lactoylglutathione lyase
MIFFGNNLIKDVRLGNKEIDDIVYNDELIYTTNKPLPFKFRFGNGLNQSDKAGLAYWRWTNINDRYIHNYLGLSIGTGQAVRSWRSVWINPIIGDLAKSYEFFGYINNTNPDNSTPAEAVLVNNCNICDVVISDDEDIYSLLINKKPFDIIIYLNTDTLQERIELLKAFSRNNQGFSAVVHAFKETSGGGYQDPSFYYNGVPYNRAFTLEKGAILCTSGQASVGAGAWVTLYITPPGQATEQYQAAEPGSGNYEARVGVGHILEKGSTVTQNWSASNSGRAETKVLTKIDMYC